MDDMTWDALARRAVGALIDQGPVVIVLVSLIASAGWLIVARLGPWVRAEIARWHATVVDGMEQREVERATDTAEKAALVASHERIERGHENALARLGEVVSEQTAAVRDLTRTTERLADRVSAWDAAREEASRG